ncbi:protein-export membrane protein SecF [Candidatus Gottesmanbacteria bacterium RIFCSPLOWO2_01_FULL_40_10]|uniref:Protein-export membrane protein SecF n=1 Tax=Candidatus Gottesmanbacteria bacterium RIFCSPHIGHO2_01_FULL_40_15 TaxID=1798376 RepID=A0A1F5Z6D0_9BACT|nr:MAG: protein-export membrane protein SecF [Candidatus Gottesmanbacteria bacterium RIFCSPHIGHO2_01_FULL_40_15]OGG22486.1 MAG: protein-export membrane protein SecF [Candidatus Gottesmanbacteria bacterium RIFCSPLOWO2_01_FULL_40_10]OGG24827.1 MAG: protein-export membrane protein SecF [Candidatus Gottesmanbacteria bacterium RIFCSPHIGHO2_12_FULL_40_13]
MYDLIGKKWWFFIFSGIIIIPGIISLILWGLTFSIDFTGGSLLELKFTEKNNQPDKSKLEKIIREKKLELVSLTQTGGNTYLVRLKPIDKDQNENFQKELNKQFGQVEELRFEIVGPTIGKETTGNAVKAVIFASVAIIIYITLSFRHIPKPYSSWKFGISAVAALIHDVLLVLGVFSIFGHFLKVEIDSLFITALLTVMGFSVHDSIVVFDRIRENLTKSTGTFSEIVNNSLLQTLARSLSTSLTVLLTLTALLLFTGESIRWFIIALLIGIASGTYSSIFNAAPLLVLWEEKKKS